MKAKAALVILFAIVISMTVSACSSSEPKPKKNDSISISAEAAGIEFLFNGNMLSVSDETSVHNRFVVCRDMEFFFTVFSKVDCGSGNCYLNSDAIYNGGKYAYAVYGEDDNGCINQPFHVSILQMDLETMEQKTLINYDTGLLYGYPSYVNDDCFVFTDMYLNKSGEVVSSVIKYNISDNTMTRIIEMGCTVELDRAFKRSDYQSLIGDHGVTRHIGERIAACTSYDEKVYCLTVSLLNGSPIYSLHIYDLNGKLIGISSPDAFNVYGSYPRWISRITVGDGWIYAATSSGNNLMCRLENNVVGEILDNSRPEEITCMSKNPGTVWTSKDELHIYSTLGSDKIVSYSTQGKEITPSIMICGNGMLTVSSDMSLPAQAQL